MTSTRGQITRVAATELPCRHGRFDMVGYRDAEGIEHIVLSRGDLDADDDSDPPLIRLHSECLTGDGFGSYRCDCGEQLDAALGAIDRMGRGAVIYLRGHEGRGIGLLAKLRTYELQDDGVDTFDANVRLGHEVDARRYDAAAAILHDLGLRSIVLLTSNPSKQQALEDLGITVVGRRSLLVPPRRENARYLTTKRQRMGHDPAPTDGAVWTALLAGRVPEHAVGPVDEMLLDRYQVLVGPGTENLVIAQMGQSADGFIASRTGDGAALTSDADREHLHRLRALVDAVVVGVGTVAADDCQLTVRSVPGRNPVRVLIDPRMRISPQARVLTDGAARTLWVADAQRSDPPPNLQPHVEVVPLPTRDGVFTPASILTALRDRGLRRVLAEGGGRTVSQFVSAGLLDHLYLTLAPVLLGDGVPGIRFAGADLIRDALRPPAHRLLIGPDTCLRFGLADARTT